MASRWRPTANLCGSAASVKKLTNARAGFIISSSKSNGRGHIAQPTATTRLQEASSDCEADHINRWKTGASRCEAAAKRKTPAVREGCRNTQPG
jgi:hypothetical protein